MNNNTAKKHIWLIVLLVLTVVAVHGISLRDGFVNWDDEMMIAGNPRIMHLSIKSVVHIFDPHSVYTDKFTEYYPVRDLSYMVDYFIGGLTPLGYHVSNLLFEIANVLLVFVIFLKLFDDAPLALLSALIFAVHPLTAGVVSWVSSRKDLMAMTFYLLSFLWFVDFYRTNRRNEQKDGYTQAIKATSGRFSGKYLALSSLMFLLALFSKASALPLPGVLAAYLFIVEDERRFKKYIAYLAVPVIIMVLYTLNLYSYSTSYFGTSTLQQCYSNDWFFLFFPELFVIYAIHFFFPFNNAPLYIEPLNRSLLEPLFVLSIPFIIFLFYAFMKYIRKDKALFFGFAWILLNMVPASNVVGLQIKIADRFAYISLAGFGLIMARILRSSTAGSRKLFILIPLLVILSYSAISFMLDLTWYNGVTLWTRQIQTRPYLPGVDKSLWGYAMLGNAYGEEGNYAKDKEYSDYVLEREPDYTPALKELGNVYAHEGEYEKAIALYQKALKVDLSSFRSTDYIIIAGMYEKMHDYKRAVEAYTMALKEPHPSYNDRGLKFKIQKLTGKIHGK